MSDIFDIKQPAYDVELIVQPYYGEVGLWINGDLACVDILPLLVESGAITIKQSLILREKLTTIHPLH